MTLSTLLSRVGLHQHVRRVPIHDGLWWWSACERCGHETVREIWRGMR